jgi:phosphoribosylformylglycinamidine synthase subunit PurQ / glutaminase
VTTVRATVAVVKFPGSLDHDSAARAARQAGADATLVHHKDDALPAGTTAVVLPGGFSYGDHLRCGAIASRAPIMQAVIRFAADGGRVLGICNGFQILCEAGLLPGVLRPNRSLSFICRQVTLEVDDDATGWTGALASGAQRSMPIKNHDGAWFGDPTEGRVVFRYDETNPTGSHERIAGIANREGNVLGMMPHPECACDPLVGSDDGRVVFDALVGAVGVIA